MPYAAHTLSLERRLHHPVHTGRLPLSSMSPDSAAPDPLSADDQSHLDGAPPGPSGPTPTSDPTPAASPATPSPQPATPTSRRHPSRQTSRANVAAALGRDHAAHTQGVITHLRRMRRSRRDGHALPHCMPGPRNPPTRDVGTPRAQRKVTSILTIQPKRRNSTFQVHREDEAVRRNVWRCHTSGVMGGGGHAQIRTM